MKNENIYYYSIGEKEKLYATIIEDAVAEFLETLNEDEYPKILSVRKYKKLIVPNNFLDNSLDDIIDNLDDEFGDPDGSYTEVSNKMKDAFEKFKEIIVSEYDVFRCEEVGDRIAVNVEDYLTKQVLPKLK